MHELVLLHIKIVAVSFESVEFTHRQWTRLTNEQNELTSTAHIDVIMANATRSLSLLGSANITVCEHEDGPKKKSARYFWYANLFGTSGRKSMQIYIYIVGW